VAQRTSPGIGYHCRPPYRVPGIEFDVRVFPVEDVSVRGEVLPVQRRIEFREHLVRIEEGLQIRTPV
jgi:hypothetical protein